MKQLNELSMIDPVTGEIRECLCPDCREKQAQIDGLEGRRQDLLEKYEQALAQIKSLKTQQAKADARARNRDLINQAFVVWQETLNKGKCKLREGGSRFEALRRLFADGYTLDHFRVACLGAAHNHPWPPHLSKHYRLQIETLCRDKNIEIFHDAGCDWLEAHGHPAPERFSGPSTVIQYAADAFEQANIGFQWDPDGRAGTALCPVSVEDLRVTVDGSRARFQCASGCDRDLILAALRVRGWKPRGAA